MGEFPKVPLGEVAAVRSGFAFKSRDWTEIGVPVVKIANVKPGGLDMSGCSFVSKEVASRAADFNLQEGDVLISMTGYVGQVAEVRTRDIPAILNQRVGRFTVKDAKKLDERFLYYCVTSPEFRERVESLGYGSVQPNVSPKAIHGIEIPLPAIKYQMAISGFLGTLDDKIELNRRMNETLEAMARAFFRDWFVDFGPTRAKMAGRDPYLAPDLWALFPDTLDAETGLPKGWELSQIGEEIEAVGGGTPSTKEPAFWDGGGHHWATPKDLSKLSSPVLLDTDRKITDAGARKISSGLLPVGTVLLSSRAPIGYLAITEVPTAVNQGFIAIVCRKRLSNVFVLFWCHETLDYMKSISGGSTFAEISKRIFRQIPVVMPSGQALGAYEGLVRPLYDRIVANARESRTLAAIRDLLLPRLMSGEIRLREAEKTAESGT